MDWATWNWVDGLFVAVLLYGAAMGAVRGLSYELATLIGLVVAVVATRLLYEPLAAWLCGRWDWNPEITRLLAVVVLVLAVLYGMRLLRLALGTLVTFSFKGPVERLGGLLAGVFRQGALFLVALLAASFVPWSLLQRAVMYDSRIGPAALPHLLEGYNVLAEKAAIIQAEIPVGVALPHAVMPPLAEPVVADEPPRWLAE
jgi:uncharacterized membrane protein required for colicin V production